MKPEYEKNNKSCGIKKGYVREATDMSCSKYPNHYTRWTDEDDEKLWHLFSEKTTIDELAKLFKRSKRAIEYRLNKLVQEMEPMTKEKLKEEYDKAFGTKRKFF